MEVKGSIEEVVFRNAENGYSVLTLDCDGEPVTAVGIFPPVAEGEFLRLQGEWQENYKFGTQFAVSRVETGRPDSKLALYRYLSSGLFPGIGQVTASAIVDAFGENTLDVIEFEPNKLAKVRGVSLKKAMALSEGVRALKQMQDTILYLQQYDVPLHIAIKIYKTYEAATRRNVEENPYRMVDEVDGVGFVTADRIAMRLGIAADSRFRISAGITHTLKEAAQSVGHTYLPKGELIAQVTELLDLPDGTLVDEILADNVVQGRIVLLDTDDGEAVMSSSSYITETAIARKIAEMMAHCRVLPLDVDADLDFYEKTHDIVLHEGQRQAIRNCVAYGVNVITGGPGTGKTTIVRCMLEILQRQGMRVCLCAPTGRAAKRLSQATGGDAKTIHRLLDLDFTGGKGHFTYNEHTRLDADIVIVDEVSMCDEYVFHALIRAIRDGGRLIMVGDKDQLPSVGAGNVLADVIASGCVPVNALTQIYRQDENSTIVSNAHNINAGIMPVLNNRSKDFFFDATRSPQETVQHIADMVTRRLPAYAGVRPQDIQVLCPMKKGVAGVENVNRMLQDALNPVRDPKQVLKVGSSELRSGDKVIHIVNNYQLEWYNETDSTAGTGVYNGDIGFVMAVDLQEPSVTVRFEDGKIAKYRQGQFDQIIPAYAISIHKSQGSEFDVVVIAVTGGNYMIMTRNLLYTAVTRAKRMVVLLGTSEAIGKMVRNTYTVRRYSMLVRFLRDCARRAGIADGDFRAQALRGAEAGAPTQSDKD